MGILNDFIIEKHEVMSDFNLEISSHPQTQNSSECTFSILIPSWNNLDMLKMCIESIKKNSHYQHQIIVHLNDGSDGSLEYVKQLGIDYTHSSGNVGVCYAMNAMAKLAVTELILYLNDDMYVCPQWDYYLFEAVQSHKSNLFYFSGTMIEPTGHNKCAVAPHDFGFERSSFKEDQLLEFCKSVNKPDWFGASWPPSLVHKELWNKVGGYSVEFSPGMGSDPDFSMKLWQAGVREFRGIGRSLVYHFQSKSTGRVKRNDGRRDFAKKWGFTISHFMKHVLKLGVVYDGSALKFSHGLKFILNSIKAKYIIK